MKKYSVLGFLALLKFVKASELSNNYYYPPPEVVCPCEYKYNPVCGSDGLTYFNVCILECISKDNQYKGLAPLFVTKDCQECICRNVNIPVCALDGTTYANECEIDCVNRNRIKHGLSIIYLAYRTRCLGPSCNCPTIASPVCGSDNVLYRNECVLKCASKNSIALGLPEIDQKNVGACRDGCSCPQTYQPVCGSDGETYDNPCKLECRNRNLHSYGYTHNLIKPLYNGRCNECYCNAVHDPVCANDGTTFENPCRFNCENEKRNNAGLPPLTELGRGKCVSCICNTVNDPVCGTDHQTYSNYCILRCENEARYQKGLHAINILYKGKCENVTSQCACNHCRNTYEPVCGDDYATYWNDCWLQCLSDCNHAKGLRTTQLVKKESCV